MQDGYCNVNIPARDLHRICSSEVHFGLLRSEQLPDDEIVMPSRAITAAARVWVK